MWRIIARYYKFIWIPLGTQFPEANSFSNTSFLFDRIWLKFEWRLLSVDFFFVLLKFLFFPRVSSYRLTDRTHKGRRQAPTLSDPPSFKHSFFLPPRQKWGGNKYFATIVEIKDFQNIHCVAIICFVGFCLNSRRDKRKGRTKGGKGRANNPSRLQICFNPLIRSSVQDLVLKILLRDYIYWK